MKHSFPFIALAVFLITHLGIYFFYFKRIIKNPLFLRIARYFLILNYGGSLMYFFGRHYVNMPPALYFLVTLSIGITFILAVATLVYQPLSFIPLFSKTRRAFLQKTIGTISLAFSGSYLGWGLIEGAMQPQIEKVKILIPNLPQTIRATQISDLHIGTLMEETKVAKIVQQTNALKSDIIFLTGDIIDANITKTQKALEELSKLSAPLGVYFVTGNHEFFHGIGDLLGTLKKLGIRVLENENVVIQKEGVGLFNLAGVYDLYGRRVGLEPNLNQALSQRKEELPTILLAHQPKFALEVQEEHKVDLILSGHTHGGQIFPFRFLIPLNQPYIQGLYQHNPQTQIYVNRGTGFWGPQMRVLTRAEITYFELVPLTDKNE